MKILFLVHRLPYPPDKGDRIRSFNIVRHLAKSHDLHICAVFDDERSDEAIQKLTRYTRSIFAAPKGSALRLPWGLVSGKPLSVINFYSRRMQKDIDRLISRHRIDTVICFCSSMAEYVFRSAVLHKVKPAPLLIMDYVDLDSDKWRQYAKYSNGLKSRVYQYECRMLARYEMEVHRRFDHSVFVSKREIDVFSRQSINIGRVHVVPNGVDMEYFCLKTDSDATVSDVDEVGPQIHKNGPLMVFTGVMDYFANEDGVVWFSQKILPLIRKSYPHAMFFIVGNRPSDRVWALSELDGVVVTGYVKNIRQYYWAADICVVPLRIARGLQNKVLEAMATGNAVVATTNASDGIVCRDDIDIAIADDENSFAKKVIALLDDKGKREKMAAEAVKNIHLHYNWEKNLQALDAIFQNK